MSVFSSAQQKREQLAILLATGNRTRCEKGAASTGTGGNGSGCVTGSFPHPGKMTEEGPTGSRHQHHGSCWTPGARVGGKALAAEGSITVPAGGAQRGQRC